MSNFRFIFLLLFISCSTSKVITDYDAKEDFSKFKTFDFYEDNGENLNELDVNRISDIIFNKLIETGFLQNSAPDFFIFFDTNTAEAQNNNSIGIGVGSGGRNGGIGISGGIPIGGKKLNEELIIKFIEAKTNDLFWEGSLNSVIKEKRTPEQKELHLKEVVQKILKEFPPKG
ncbi:DUF4136 domain-containing protein [uncultured Polaribacter sp.]|uniref:DUF4136 domain-containing protein n=1 Tax=uncultured Polaribacter sp. TaxID=174711 RepID=UPI002614B96F|nr:DUF4136 domain-containing protein [uncultured Polaribacter sp.]